MMRDLDFVTPCEFRFHEKKQICAKKNRSCSRKMGVPSLQDLAANIVYSQHSVETIRDNEYPSEVIRLVECAAPRVWKTFNLTEQHIWEDVASTCTNALHLVQVVYIDIVQRVYGKSSNISKLMYSICPGNLNGGYYKLKSAFSDIAYDIFEKGTHAWLPHGKYRDSEDPWYQKTDDTSCSDVFECMVFDYKKKRRVATPEFHDAFIKKMRQSIEAVQSAHIALSCLNGNPFIAPKLLRYKKTYRKDFVTRFLSKMAMFIESGEELLQSSRPKKRFRRDE